MRVDLALLANLVEEYLRGDFAFFMGRLHYNGYGRGGDFGPFGVVEAQKTHAVRHERVEVLAGAVDVRQGPAVGREDKGRGLAVDLLGQVRLECLWVNAVVFENELRETKAVGFERVDKAAEALDAARDQAGFCCSPR